jgi:hypothetical protein
LTSRIKMLFQKDKVCTFCNSHIMQKPDTWMELLIELWEFIETFMNSWCSVIVASSTSARIAIEHVLADKFSSGIFVSDVESICELPSVHQQTWNTKFSRLNFAPIVSAYAGTQLIAVTRHNHWVEAHQPEPTSSSNLECRSGLGV